MKKEEEREEVTSYSLALKEKSMWTIDWSAWLTITQNAPK